MYYVYFLEFDLTACLQSPQYHSYRKRTTKTPNENKVQISDVVAVTIENHTGSLPVIQKHVTHTPSTHPLSCCLQKGASTPTCAYTYTLSSYSFFSLLLKHSVVVINHNARVNYSQANCCCLGSKQLVDTKSVRPARSQL